MLQRVTDALAALVPASRAGVAEALAGIGWEPILDVTPARRVRTFQLELEPAN